jgi:predicted ester cyclase
MSAEANKASIQRTIKEFFNQENLAAAAELIAADYIEHDPAPPAWPTGRAGLTHAVRLFHTAFPDIRWSIEDLIAEGDKVAVRLTAQGSHQGDFMGIPPTGRRATWTETHIVRIVDGQQVEHWGNRDMFGLLQQLGVIPQPR